MKKLFLFFALALMMLSCNAQEPNKATSGVEKFVAEHQGSDDIKAKLTSITSELDTYIVSAEALYNEYQQTQDAARKEAIEVEFDGVSEKMNAVIMKAIKENRDNVIPAYFAKQIMYELDYEQLKEFCAEGTGYYDCAEMDAPKKILAGLAKRAPGKMFTDIEMQDIDGITRKLSEYVGHGNYVLIDFWASWCGPCRAEMPNVKAAYDKYHSKGFEIVGLSLDNKKEAWANAINQMNLNWIHLSDLKGWQSVAADVYGITSIPASILVDPEGKIVTTDLRGEKLEKALEKIYLQ